MSWLSYRNYTLWHKAGWFPIKAKICSLTKNRIGWYRFFFFIRTTLCLCLLLPPFLCSFISHFSFPVLLFPSLLLPHCHTLLLPLFPFLPLYPSLCNQSCDWAVFTGSSQGPVSVTHSLYNHSLHLTLHSLYLLWSDYRGSNRKQTPPYTHTPSAFILKLSHACCAPPVMAGQ